MVFELKLNHIYEYLFLKEGNREIPIENELIRLTRYISSLPKKIKKQDIDKDRFCFLDEVTYNEEENVITLLFKSAKHSYRAPLINKNTIEERENPKMLDEGEQIKTHLLIKFSNGDAIVFSETFRNALSLNIITEYFNHFSFYYNNRHSRDKIKGHFTSDMIPRDDFKEVLDNMKRVICASIYIEKQILGSDTLNFSNMTDNIQEDIIIEVKSKRGESIKHAVYDFLAKCGGNSKIKKIRAKGVLPNKSESVIDTSFILKKEYIEAQQNEDTGEINTSYMFSQLTKLAQDF